MRNPPDSESAKEAQRRSWALAFSVGWELAAFTGLAFAFGYWLDGRYGSSPWGVLVCTLLGIGYGLYRFVRAFTVKDGGGPGRG